jgi:PIN domain nuclease of toxin-antitoxin system
MRMGRAGGGTGETAVASVSARAYIGRLIDEAALRERPLALDSQVLILYLEDRAPIAGLVTPIIEQRVVPVVISSVTLAEVLVLPARQGDPAGIESLRRAVLGLPSLAVVPLDIAVAVETALVRGQFGFHLPDAAVIATARMLNASGLVGNDRRWRAKTLGISYHHLDDILSL